MLAAVLMTAALSWSGSPIWGNNQNQYVYFRKVIKYDDGETPIHASVNITAFPHSHRQKLLGAYRLYINGKVAGVGPGRGECSYGKPMTDKTCTLVDSIDVSKNINLNNKSLTIAVQSYCDGGDDRRGVLADFQVVFKSGKKIIIGTDANWLTLDASPYHNPYNSISTMYSAPRENLIAKYYPTNWLSPSYATTPDWVPATVQPLFSTIQKQSLPLDIFEESPSYVRVNNSFVFFDFKREVNAAISLSLSTFNGYVEVTLGEELVNNTQYEVLYPMRTGNKYRYVWKAGGFGGDSRPSEFFIHEYALFRYGMMRLCETADADGCTTHAALATRPTINNLSSLVTRYPFDEMKSSFSSDSVVLNNIYSLCSNTIRDTSLDTFTDSQTRERTPYEADGYITSLSRFVLQSGWQWQKHSAINVFLNPTWPTEWRQFTPFIAYNIYMESRDLDVSSDYWNYLVESTQIRCFNTSIGLIDFTNCSRSGTRDIVDWPIVYRDGYIMTNINTVVNSFAVGSMTLLSRLGRALGKNTTQLENTADIISNMITTKLFNNKTGLFVDGLDGASGHSAWQAQTNVLWHLSLEPKFKAKLPNLKNIKKLFEEKRIAGSVYGVLAFLQALYDNYEDHGKFALEMLTQCDTNSWCHMLQVGATATMEAWSREGKPNLTWSHPWATAALIAIKTGIMGLRPLAPGYVSYLIQPQPGDLTQAAAVFPQSLYLSPFKISFIRTNTSFLLSYDSPSGTSGTACLPVLGNSLLLLLDDKPVVSYNKSTYLCTDNIPSGEHVVKLV